MFETCTTFVDDIPVDVVDEDVDRGHELYCIYDECATVLGPIRSSSIRWSDNWPSLQIVQIKILVCCPKDVLHIFLLEIVYCPNSITTNVLLHM